LKVVARAADKYSGGKFQLMLEYFLQSVAQSMMRFDEMARTFLKSGSPASRQA
jgi:hypothetical protein